MTRRSAVVCLGVMLGLIALTVPAATKVNAQSQADIPPRTWISRPLSPNGGFFGGGKHARLAMNTATGRVYLAGGDRDNSDAGQTNVWSYGIADGTWVKEYPSCGPAGEVVPAQPDDVVWVYDSRRDRFIMTPGFYFDVAGYLAKCPSSGATPQYTAMTFDPRARKWSPPAFPGPDPSLHGGGYGGDNYGKFGVYDPVTDRLFRVTTSGWGGTMGILDLATNAWSQAPFGHPDTNSPLREIHAEWEQAAIDVQGRAIYFISPYGIFQNQPSDPIYKKLIRFSIDTNTVEVVSDLPAAYALFEAERSNMVFDPINRVLLMPNMANLDGEIVRLFIYHVDSRTWETEEIPNRGLADGSRPVMGNTAVFDTVNNVMMLIGGHARSTDDGGGMSRLDPSRSLGAPTVFWLYRYAPGVAPTPLPAIASPAPSPTPSTPAPTPNPPTASAPKPTPTPVAATPSPTTSSSPSASQTSATNAVTSAASVAAGSWKAVPNSQLASVLPSPLPDIGFNSPASIMSAWGGGTWDEARQQLLVWGGGHADYSGNEIYAFSLATLKWARLTNPSPDLMMTTADTPRRSTLEVRADGQPGSRHTYAGMLYMPTVDRMFATGGSLWMSGGPSQKTWSFDPAAKTWTEKSYPSGQQVLTAISAWDPVLNGVWFPFRGGAYFYSPENDTWTLKATDWMEPDWNAPKMMALHQAKRKLFVVGGDGGAANTWMIDVSGTRPTFSVVALTGDLTPTKVAAPGLVYDTKRQQLVMWAGGRDLYILDPDTLAITKETLTGGDTPTTNPQVAGTYGRFQYIASQDLYIVVNSTSENVFLGRRSGSAPTNVAIPSPSTPAPPVATPAPTPTPQPVASKPSTPAPTTPTATSQPTPPTASTPTSATSAPPVSAPTATPPKPSTSTPTTTAAATPAPTAVAPKPTPPPPGSPATAPSPTSSAPTPPSSSTSSSPVSGTPTATTPKPPTSTPPTAAATTPAPTASAPKPTPPPPGSLATAPTQSTVPTGSVAALPSGGGAPTGSGTSSAGLTGASSSTSTAPTAAADATTRPRPSATVPTPSDGGGATQTVRPSAALAGVVNATVVAPATDSRRATGDGAPRIVASLTRPDRTPRPASADPTAVGPNEVAGFKISFVNPAQPVVNGRVRIVIEADAAGDSRDWMHVVAVDGVLVYRGNSPTFTWDTRGVPNGRHVVSALVRTPGGTHARTSMVLTVSNAKGERDADRRLRAQQ